MILCYCVSATQQRCAAMCRMSNIIDFIVHILCRLTGKELELFHGRSDDDDDQNSKPGSDAEEEIHIEFPDTDCEESDEDELRGNISTIAYKYTAPDSNEWFSVVQSSIISIIRIG